MKNIKINKKFFKRVVSSVSFVFVGLFTSNVMSGCAVSELDTSQLELITDELDDEFEDKNIINDYSYYDNGNVETSQTNSHDNSTNYPSFTLEDSNLDDSQKLLLNMNVSFSKEQVDLLETSLDDIQVNYQYEELFGIDEVFEKYNSRTQNISVLSSGDLINNNVLNEEKLYQSVLENNNVFLKTTNTNNQELSKANLKLVCSYIAEQVNNILENNSKIDVESLEEKLSNLKIFEYSEFSYGYYDYTNDTLGIGMSSIVNTQKNKEMRDILKETVFHETNHLIQAASNEEIENADYTYRMGPCYKWNDLKVNSLYWDFLLEGSAEEKMLDCVNQSKSLTYVNDQIAFGLIKLSTTLSNSTIPLSALEDATFSDNLDDLFVQFGCKNEKEQKEVIRLFYAYNLIYHTNSTSSSEDFYNTYEEKTGLRFSYSQKSDYAFSLECSNTLTLSKLFYKNLGKILTSNSLTTQQVFSFISLYEANINRILHYDRCSNYDLLEDFFVEYEQIQDEFYQQVATALNISEEIVENLYNAYNDNYRGSVNELAFLSKDKEEYCLKLNNELKNNYYYSIQKVYKNYSLTHDSLR